MILREFWVVEAMQVNMNEIHSINFQSRALDKDGFAEYWHYFNYPAQQIPGDPTADPAHPPCRDPCQDEVVEDDEDEHGGDDGGGERVDQLVVQLQVQVQVDG